MSTTPSPRRGEIWLVNLDPTVGREIRKKRPVVVVSSDAVGRLPIKLCVPLTGWQSKFSNAVWYVKIEPDSENNLSKDSSCDTLQTRCLDEKRFIKKMGRMSPTLMEDITAAIAAVVEYQ